MSHLYHCAGTQLEPGALRRMPLLLRVDPERVKNRSVGEFITEVWDNSEQRRRRIQNRSVWGYRRKENTEQ